MTFIRVMAFVAATFMAIATQAANFQFQDEHCLYSLFSATKTATVQQFIGKSSTKTVTIPSDILCMDDGKTYKVTEISAYAFEGSNVVTVNFPATLKTIGWGAFKDCPRLFKGKALTIPSSVTTIEEEAFANGKFTSLTIPASIKTIGDRAFQGSAITAVSFEKPKSSLKLGDAVFQKCTSLKTISLPANLTSMGANALADCPLLTSAVFPSSLKTIPQQCFHNCRNLTSVTIPSGVTAIGWGAFASTGVQTISLPTSIKTIGQNAFSGSSLTAITLPAGLTAVPYCCFSGSELLKSVTIPSTVTKIESGAFYECSALVSIRCDAVTPPAIADDSAFSDASYSKATLTLPAQSVAAYSVASTWKLFNWFATLGVEDVQTQSPQEAEWFDLNGNRVTPDVPGIYIKRQGNTVSKVMVK